MKTKKAKVHLLPTEDITGLYSFNNKLIYNPEGGSSHTRNNKHLNFTIEEKIKGGKEVYYIDKFTNKVTSSGGAEYGSKQNVIIATTDTKLAGSITRNKDGGKSIIYGLPKIPQSFVEEYAKQGGIDVVLVEYENNVIDSIFNKHINEYIKWKKTLDI